MSPSKGAKAFQFHKGTIRTAEGTRMGRRPQFQFHKGTIRTSTGILFDKAGTVFQFHKGTIRTAISSCERRGILYFNSIKVQLERFFFISFFPDKPFQFHKGTIRTR